ncbi:PAQR family membrane homeostasis protein TrhA [Neptunicella sp. SCSIO 80796]|uniref:PAQR family membrane homeostasis protein TrhA n=1 Tax=Neptunicella plasticusilytica TaxID=3117012 RepID=UPI003A4DDFA9
MSIIPIPGFSEPVNAISHLLTAGVFLILAIFTLYKGRGNTARQLSLLVFSFFAVALFALSGVYHLLEKGSQASLVLRILDHTAIFTMIAGSFTPFHIILLRGRSRWLPLLIIWPLAITGLTLTAIFFRSMSEGLLLSFFLAMGWMGIFTVIRVWTISKSVAQLIVVGALFYTIGALLDYAQWPVLIDGVIGAHELFHFTIIAAALCHWFAIYNIAYYPLKNELTIVVREFPGQFQAYLFGENCIAKAPTKAELMAGLRHWLVRTYPQKLVPEKIRFKFYQEEWVKLD